MSSIVVVGSINADLVFTCKNRPNKGETILGEGFMTIPGGKGANQAVAAARLGGEVTMIGLVGNDIYGSKMILNLKDHGINTDCVGVTDTETGVAGIVVDDEDNSIIVIPGANSRLDERVVQNYEMVLREADIVIMQLEIPVETIARVLDICHDAGTVTILNPAPAQKLPPSIIAKSTYLTPNEHEVKLLFGERPLDELLKEHPNRLIVTQGSQGAIFFDGSKVQHIEGIAVDVVDTTGAGDTFNGALAYRLSQGDTLANAIGYANRAAAISVTQMGAQGGMPDGEVMMGWMKGD